MERRAAAHEHLLGQLGLAVRERRGAVGLTRRELSQRAGVSERFLVQLEAGEGNISVARLHDVAVALGVSAAALLTLAPVGAPRAPVNHRRVVALVGLRGAGKSTIGRRAAEQLGVPFVELDTLVEQRAGTRLEAMFELHGAAYYRRVEREALHDFLARREAAVLATGGGLVTDTATYELLRREAVTVWLRARPEDHWDRVVQQGDARPMANRSDAMNDLRRLLHARGPLYEQAQVVVDTRALGLARSVRAVVRAARAPLHSDLSRGDADANTMRHRSLDD